MVYNSLTINRTGVRTEGERKMENKFIKDVCAELEREAERLKTMPVGKWLKIRAMERAEAKQFGMTEMEYRKELHGGATI